MQNSSVCTVCTFDLISPADLTHFDVRDEGRREGFDAVVERKDLFSVPRHALRSRLGGHVSVSVVTSHHPGSRLGGHVSLSLVTSHQSSRLCVWSLWSRPIHSHVSAVTLQSHPIISMVTSHITMSTVTSHIILPHYPWSRLASSYPWSRLILSKVASHPSLARPRLGLLLVSGHVSSRSGHVPSYPCSRLASSYPWSRLILSMVTSRLIQGHVSSYPWSRLASSEVTSHPRPALALASSSSLVTSQAYPVTSHRIRGHVSHHLIHSHVSHYPRSRLTLSKVTSHLIQGHVSPQPCPPWPWPPRSL
eukprot:3026111-Rhodomonas_salina.2